MSTLPTSTQLGNTSIVKYMDDGGTTTADKRNVSPMQRIHTEENVNTTIREAMMLVFKR